MYGPAPVGHFYATEIAELHGEAFPGLINLSYVTFVATDRSGADEIFRAHEVAHQWWGIGVDFASYRDQWLSEGLATFSGLWYLQVVRKEPGPYFNQLRTWKTSIISRSHDAGPISLGYRVVTNRNEADYEIIVYQKGAWVMHMLRTLMINLKTMQEDRFQNMMRDFFTTYNGKVASTDDFQRMVEKHTGQPMGWFFDQWVRGTAIPTYSVVWAVTDAGDGMFRTRLKVVQTGVPETFQMYVPVTLQLSDGGVLRARVLVKGAETTVDLAPVGSRPRSLTFNDFEGVLATVADVTKAN
jgi:aminopeptidase N